MHSAAAFHPHPMAQQGQGRWVAGTGRPGGRDIGTSSARTGSGAPSLSIFLSQSQTLVPNDGGGRVADSDESESAQSLRRPDVHYEQWCRAHGRTGLRADGRAQAGKGADYGAPSAAGEQGGVLWVNQEPYRALSAPA
jgi:hypothetical protein